MNIDIQTQNFPLTPAIETSVRQQVEKAIAKSEREVVGVSVFMSDINGPKGGPDKKVQINIHMAPKVFIHAEHVCSDLYNAISTVARQASSALQKRVSKRRRLQRHRLRRQRQTPEPQVELEAVAAF